MRKLNYIMPLLLLIAVVSCKPKGNDDPVAKLAALKEQKAAIETQITALEQELVTKGVIEKKLPTVALTELKVAPFSHFIDLQGKVDADESVAATSKMPGVLKRILVKNGDNVKKGQLLAELEDAVMLSSINELKGQLQVAEDLYNRQKSLWDQNIGSEVQYIQAKNNKESLERSMATLKENWNNTRIFAPTSGTVDNVILNPGEAISPGVPLAIILNLSKLKVKGEVTEAYASKVSKGDKVQVHFPDTGKDVITTVNYVSRSINPVSRTFSVESAVLNGDYKANQIAVLKIIDYQNPKAIVIPVNLIQSSQEGDFVLVAEKTGVDNQATIKRVVVKQGQNYNGYVEILSGLKAGDLVVSTGFQDINNGETVLF
ncbi:MAG TPA: efflux RND transporter periplasmic adaptor subunit [Saprospiraceae bacterium]|nr:efflux RND transporter periplasmic adaptor subunit [Saprospiraceae bacterium]